MWNVGLDEAQAGIKIAWRNINNLRYADDTILLTESAEELKSLLMKVKEESEKVGLKFNIQKAKIMASGPITSWQIDGETAETVSDFIFLGSKITADGDCSHEIKRRLLLGRKAMTNLDSFKKQRHYFANKGPFSQSYGFSSSHVWMWELDHKESLVPKNWCFWAAVLEKTLGSPLDCKEIQLVYPKGNQSWIFIGRIDAEAETPILWPPDAKNWLICKDPGAGKHWRQGDKETTEGEIVGWHHWLNGHEPEQALAVGHGQLSLVCCSPWCHKKSDVTEQLNWTELAAQSRPTLWDPMDCSPPGSCVHGDSPGQDYWSGLPCPPPVDLPNPGIEHMSPALQADSLPSEPPGKPSHTLLLEKPQLWLYRHLLAKWCLFNMLSRFVIAFLPRRKSFNFMAAVTISVILEPKKIKSVTGSNFSSSICHGVMGSDARS